MRQHPPLNDADARSMAPDWNQGGSTPCLHRAFGVFSAANAVGERLSGSPKRSAPPTPANSTRLTACLRCDQQPGPSAINRSTASGFGDDATGYPSPCANTLLSTSVSSPRCRCGVESEFPPPMGLCWSVANDNLDGRTSESVAELSEMAYTGKPFQGDER
jgi:hypothetical protein